MRNFVAVVFDDKDHAYQGLHALWQLDFAGEITVHGTTVVHRDRLGHIAVDTKATHPVFATAVGVGIGALLGAIAGPVGVAVGIAGGAAIGAATGAVVGGAVDLDRSDTRAQAQIETGALLSRGQAAVIADVSEDWEEHLDLGMRELGGVVHRRSSADLHHDENPGNEFSPATNYLYPYAYVPGAYPSLAGW
ncbi:hypothetical protein [Novosphingobium sp. FSW06-99]|uniref:hypothetical protein n=1 Tax=Novosphingobium sp. FSW06-99 TaxID=1739113 RepID=UPI00076DBF7B|nr:hypothetical protein [Novosphingobium sp. FSW06-99]KUR71999.1 hypothetical protein AQZ49_20970 [Novosphingobium sp. FSW06-99]